MNTLTAMGLTVHLTDEPDPNNDKEINCANVVYVNITMTMNDQMLSSIAGHTTVPTIWQAIKE